MLLVKVMIQSAYHFADSPHVTPGLVIKTYCFHPSLLLTFPSLSVSPLSSSRCLPHLHFCWLLCTINISCVMWLFWIVWACVCAPMSLCLRACTCTHTYNVSAPAYVHVCVCVSVPQYQILLSQLSASLSLVVICLSTSQPSTSPVSLSFFLSSEVFICIPLLLSPLSFLFHCFLGLFFHSILSLGALSPSLPPSQSTPHFFFFFSCITFNLWPHSGYFHLRASLS